MQTTRSCLPPRAKDLTGQRFGRLTALEPMPDIPGRGLVWRCRCDCGGEKMAPSSKLLSGKVRSCGCIKLEQQDKRNITGQRFGRLVAEELVEYNQKNEDCWRFRCDCGNEKIMPASKVKWYGVRSCGCLQSEHIENLRKQDISGKLFGRLTALKPTEEHDSSGSIIWECRCTCGKTVYYSVNHLTRGSTRSCGCLYRETRETSSQNRWDAVDGTLLSALIAANEPHANNTSGCTGVCFDKRSEKWQAYINFQKKRYRLGQFRTKEQAIRARKDAEERLFDPIIQNRWQQLSQKARCRYLAGLEKTFGMEEESEAL